ncbi:MAG: exo-alpha-sialidase [Phycisphaeraceae bacterium]|nr:exo-alpha-sialidase [Phycisphaeraceae bacterium]
MMTIAKQDTSRCVFGWLCLLVGVISSVAISADSTIEAGEVEIVPRTSPVLMEEAVDIEPEVWLADEIKAKGAEVIWVKAIWGRNDDHWYDRWEQKAPWGDTSPWYIICPRIVWFQGKLFALFAEHNLPHAAGDTVVHVMTSDDDGQTWETVVHYEAEKGFTNNHLTVTSDHRLMLAGIHLNSDRMMAAFSEDGVSWSPLQQFTTPDGQGPGVIFQLAWNKGKAYGINREGIPWVSDDGMHYLPVDVQSPSEGTVGGNEVASTFLKDQWIAFQRSGVVASSLPPYTQWDINKTNSKGAHSYGGPALLTLPDGQVIAGSRASGFRDLGGKFGGHMAVVFRYEDGLLTPLLGFETGATMTGYPGLTWADGYLYVSFLRDRPGRDGWDSCRGQFCLAKLKWPG